MTNKIPLAATTEGAGGFLLPPEQGEILVEGILVETGAVQIAGDIRRTTARKTNFPIWLGRPTAGPVGEGENKETTGAEFGQGTLNVKKFASIVVFTDEMIQDLQNGDLSVLVDAGVRQALCVAIDAHAVGLTSGKFIKKGAEPTELGSTFDSALIAKFSAPGVVIASGNETQIQEGVSEGINFLEENGYGNPDDIAVLVGFGFQKALRNARDGFKRPLYDGGQFAGQTIDAFYNLDRAHSTNLVSLSAATIEAEVEVKTAPTKQVIKNSGTNREKLFFVGQPVKSKEGATFFKESFIGKLVGKTEEYSEFETVNAEGVAIKAGVKEETQTLQFGKPVGLVAHKPNIHVRVREDVIVRTSNEANLKIGGEERRLFQENLTAVLYETRLGFFVHDAKRAGIVLYKF